jgi:oxaloacetate decarboxylase gamma subunit
MTITEMFQQSAILTVLGMAVVFAFLWLMIICVESVGKLIHKLGWDKDAAPAKATKPAQKASPPSGEGGVPPEITAAIIAAVTEYRKSEG